MIPGDLLSAAAFVLTGAAMIWRMGGVVSRVETLLTLLSEKVQGIDVRLSLVERLERAAPPSTRLRKKK